MQTPRAFCYRILPRLYDWAFVALALLIILDDTHPQQMGVVLYKCALVTLGAVLGYWIDRSLFPYARPHILIYDIAKSAEPTKPQTVAALFMLRRAAIVFACILGLTMGM